MCIYLLMSRGNANASVCVSLLSLSMYNSKKNTFDNKYSMVPYMKVLQEINFIVFRIYLCTRVFEFKDF